MKIRCVRAFFTDTAGIARLIHKDDIPNRCARLKTYVAIAIKFAEFKELDKSDPSSSAYKMIDLISQNC